MSTISRMQKVDLSPYARLGCRLESPGDARQGKKRGNAAQIRHLVEDVIWQIRKPWSGEPQIRGHAHSDHSSGNETARQPEQRANQQLQDLVRPWTIAGPVPSHAYPHTLVRWQKGGRF